MESILESIKKLLGIDSSYEVFDTDIIIAINTAIQSLAQIGVGIPGEFQIIDDTATWNDYLGDQECKLAFVKNYIQLKTKMLFDPPTSSIVAEAYNKQLEELTFRISVTVDPGEEE